MGRKERWGEERKDGGKRGDDAWLFVVLVLFFESSFLIFVTILFSFYLFLERTSFLCNILFLLCTTCSSNESTMLRWMETWEEG